MTESPELRWWEPVVAPADLVAGVFEGGGAKGLLYEGALAAMLARDRPRWFGAVAGSSAGGIVATLVAAGLRPEEIAEHIPGALAALDPPSRWTGLARMRNGRGYIPSEPLEEWLREVLRRHVGDDTVSFATLYQRSGIELHLVAVDLELRRPIVFNHHETPDLPVVQGVLASTAIPFVFTPRLKDETSLIVDGGVSANFPRFVFEDRSYREAAGLPPAPWPVVGFLLDEAGGGAATSREEAGSPVLRGLAGPLLLPLRLVFVWLPRVLRWNTTSRDARFPRPRHWAARAALETLDGVLMFSAAPLIFFGGAIAFTLIVAVGGYHIAWRALARTVTNPPGELTGEWLEWFADVGVQALVSLLPIYVWVIVMGLFLAGAHVWPGARLVGYGLARTFVANPGAPAWAGVHPGDFVARLRAPPGLETLRDRTGAGELEAAVGEAAAAAHLMLDRLDAEAPS